MFCFGKKLILFNLYYTFSLNWCCWYNCCWRWCCWERTLSCRSVPETSRLSLGCRCRLSSKSIWSQKTLERSREERRSGLEEQSSVRGSCTWNGGRVCTSWYIWKKKDSIKINLGLTKNDLELKVIYVKCQQNWIEKIALLFKNIDNLLLLNGQTSFSRILLKFILTLIKLFS